MRIELSESSEAREWRDLEICRSFDWGQTHITLDSHMKLKHVEDFIPVLEDELKLYQSTAEKIHRIDFDYSCPPGIWKSIIDGDIAGSKD